MKYEVGKIYRDNMNENLIMVIVDVKDSYDPMIHQRGLRYWYYFIDQPDNIYDAFEWEMTDGWEEINGR